MGFDGFYYVFVNNTGLSSKSDYHQSWQDCLNYKEILLNFKDNKSSLYAILLLAGYRQIGG